MLTRKKHPMKREVLQKNAHVIEGVFERKQELERLFVGIENGWQLVAEK